jgi:hypothetical protein
LDQVYLIQEFMQEEVEVVLMDQQVELLELAEVELEEKVHVLQELQEQLILVVEQEEQVQEPAVRESLS